jgi:hypothetical protein
MIFKDPHNLPVDQTMDGGDSAARAGILAMVRHPQRVSLSQYFIKEQPVRHPFDAPWNNPKNFSRDQLMCLLPAITTTQARRLFFQRMKAFFFAPNTERDFKGTTKYPWPHKVTDFQGVTTWRMFDGPDPLFLNHIGAMIIKGKVWQWYWLLPNCYAVHFLAMFIHSKTKHYEENQIICESYIYDTLSIFKIIHPGWEKISEEYWGGWRNEIEYHHALKEFIRDK